MRLMSPFLPSLFCSLLLAGCETSILNVEGGTSGAPVAPLETKYHPSDEDIQAGQRAFKEGAFGLARDAFKKAVEASPKDGNAWLGLAASYDRLRRFDLADLAYKEASALGVDRFLIANNRGYSYLLRGDFKNALAQFEIARNLKPTDMTVENNLRLLAGSRHHVRRLDTAYE